MKREWRARTNDKIDLRTKRESEVFVAHKLMHLKFLDDTHFCNALQFE